MQIRKIRPEDAADVAALYAPYVRNTTFSFEYDAPDAAEIARRMADLTPRFPWIAAVEGDRLLGYAYAGPNFVRSAYAWGADLSVYVAEDALGQGIGRRLYQVLEEILRRQGFCVLYGVVTGENRRSCLFHEALGYRRCAEFPATGFKHGKWLSTFWYEKRLRQDAPKAPPVSWLQLDLCDILEGENG